MLRIFPYRAQKTSHTAGTLCAIKSGINEDGGIHAAVVNKLPFFMNPNTYLQKYFVAKVKEKTMAKKNFWLGMLVMVLAFGMTVVGCDNDPTDDNGGNTVGAFVLTDIPATYNGKYAYFEALNSSVYIVGCQSVNMSTKTLALSQILNGRASLPVWIVTNAGSVSKYSGNDIFTQNDKWGVAIFNTAIVTDESRGIAGIYFSGSVVFTNGYAEKSVNNGTVIPY
jgi:hypothetical protein